MGKMHKNFFTFSADSHSKLGFSLGQTFRENAKFAVATIEREINEFRRLRALEMLAITEKYFPQYVEELQGYAKGADVNFHHLWMASLEDEFYDADQITRCTNIITNNGKLIAHNEDSNLGTEDHLSVVRMTCEDTTSLSIYYCNTLGGNSIGINSHGYAFALNTLLFTESKVGVPRNVLSRFMLDTKNPEQDLQFLKNIPRGSGYNHNIVDMSGNILNVEITANEIAISRPNSPFVHSNHCLVARSNSEIVDAYTTIQRLETARKYVKTSHEKKELVDILNKISQGENTSLKKVRVEDEEIDTLAQIILDTEKRVMSVWLKRESEMGWIDYPIDFISP